jgi:thymidine phosphorylase
MMNHAESSTSDSLTLRWLGIDTYKEAVIYMRKDCPVCRSEGFEVQSRIHVSLGDKKILATLHHIENGLLDECQASLSKYAWKLLGAKEGDQITLSHPLPLYSLSFVRSKVYGNKLREQEIERIVEDIVKGHYSDVHIATFITACAGGRLDENEIIALTKAMVDNGKRINWQKPMIVDKHCVGGLPGNRTSLIVVPIVAAFGLTMPKTSSRAITSPAGTADTMEVLAPVDLSSEEMQQVVKQHGGCLVWGGAQELSPADDVLIRVERSIDLDSEGQLIASVLSKKIAAGSTHTVIDIPVGPSAKVRTFEMGQSLRSLFECVAKALNVNLKVILSDGSQPIGRGIGPALEAQDVLDVLQNAPQAPKDLVEKSIHLAGEILEFSNDVKPGEGKVIARELITTGKAWQKFKDICNAQGGLRIPPQAKYKKEIQSPFQGKVRSIDNRQLSRIAKLAGAPDDKAAGVYLHTPLESLVEKGEPLFTVHAESSGELRYALSVLEKLPDIVLVEAYE